jgi:hypothetical protein
MYRQPKRPLLTLVTLLLAATTAGADDTASLDGWPAWVHKAMNAEVKRLKYRDVTTPDESVRARLPGKPQDPEPMEGGWYFAADIKAESPFECYLYTSSMDLATLINVVAEANLEAVAGSPDNLGNRRIYHTSAGAVAGMPYLGLEWLYTVQRDGQTMVGFTKVRAAAKGNHALLCSHNYIGYRDTFARAFSQFVTNTQFDDDTPAPFYEEIAELDMNSSGNGVVYTSFTTDEEGDIRIYSAEASLMPVDAATLTTNDSYTISFTTPEGTLLRAYSIDVENGELAANLNLGRNDEGTWVSSGMLQGKELAFEIDGSLEPTSEWTQLAIARDLFAGDAASADALIWMPSIDPTQFVAASMTRDDAEVERQARMTLGPLSYTGRFDASGNLENADMAIGPVSIRIERTWSTGSLLQ